MLDLAHGLLLLYEGHPPEHPEWTCDLRCSLRHFLASEIMVEFTLEAAERHGFQCISMHFNNRFHTKSVSDQESGCQSFGI